MIVLVISLFALSFAILLIFFIKKTETENEENNQQSNALSKLSLDEFYNLSCELLEKLGLSIKESSRVSEREIDIFTENPAPLIGGPVIVHLSFHPTGGLVSTVDVMNFTSNLIGERKGKALLITTGKIAPEVEFLPELPAIEFIDGEKLIQLSSQYEITLPSEKEGSQKN